MSKPSKSTRKDDKLQQLERELAAQKKKNAELQKQKTIRLDDAQLESIFTRLEQNIEWSTDRVVDEMPRYVTTPQFGERKNNSDFFFFNSESYYCLDFFRTWFFYRMGYTYLRKAILERGVGKAFCFDFCYNGKHLLLHTGR